MSWSILSVSIRCEYDTVAARQRARQIAGFLGFDTQDQTRISTAVSEIARNAFNYAQGGRVEYMLEGRTAPQLFIIKVSDSGAGIGNLKTILEGRYESPTGMGHGIIGARRLMDHFEIQSNSEGTSIWLKKLLPRRAPILKESDLGRIAAALASERPQDAYQELRLQNQELLAALDEVRAKQSELQHVNRELEDTNRGVVALYAELDEKADHLRRADELKTKFLSNMSHEFRSPLNSILALTGLLLNGVDGDLEAEQSQQVQYVRTAAQDLLELVNDLLDLAKVEAGKVEAKPVDFEVADLFAALRGMLRPLLLNQSIDLVFEDVRGIPRMFSDEGKVSQILRNIISNALKFTEQGEVRVSAELGHDRDIILSVRDTGVGIAPEDQERIFQDFAQIDSPIQRRVKGTGLGLPLSKKLAGLLGGEIHVQSQVGMGSVFILRLPIRYAVSEDQPPAPQPTSVDEPGSVPVLIVEDGPDMRVVYRSLLRGSGFRPILASTVREAQDLLEQIRPHAILLDILLRSEDTWRFLAQLKEEEETRGIPVLIASTVEDQDKAYHLGVDDYLVKPLDRDDLIARLKAATADTVLIIDDSEADRYVLKQHLTGWLRAINEASNGAEGFARAVEDQPSAIILDLSMPGISGFEVLDRLKDNPLTRHIPVLICTSRMLTSEERRRLEEKSVSILDKKDIGFMDLKQTVRRAVREAGAVATAS
jgi:signal transduction histidine kinase/CheY-like chemotaxis protein